MRSLTELANRVREDLARTAHPSAAWTTPRRSPQGEHVYDVVIVGAGQGGLAVAHGLQRSRIDNVLLIDRAVRGGEGVWTQYARMPTLRSPKEFTGPDLGVPSLTYQSWHECVYGVAHWLALDRIAKEDWHRYLAWYRETLAIPVRNNTELIGIEAVAGLGLRLRVVASTAASGKSFDADAGQGVAVHGDVGTVLCRRLVLATGQDGTGRWSVPRAFHELPSTAYATTAQAIDFDSLRGRSVIVIGQGASAADNAATALEHGARKVTMLVRRPELQRVQPYLWLTFTGFLRHIGDMPDGWRWRFMNRIMSLREAMPQPTWDRMARHAGFRLALDAQVLSAQMRASRCELATARGSFVADFVILGTGIEIDLAARPELAAHARSIATWGDRFLPPTGEENPRLARFPYHSRGASFTAKRNGEDSYLDLIHDFTIGSTLSFGPFGCSINAMNIAVPRIVNGITHGLFESDIARHWDALSSYDVPIFDPVGAVQR